MEMIGLEPRLQVAHAVVWILSYHRSAFFPQQVSDLEILTMLPL